MKEETKIVVKTMGFTTVGIWFCSALAILCGAPVGVFLGTVVATLFIWFFGFMVVT